MDTLEQKHKQPGPPPGGLSSVRLGKIAHDFNNMLTLVLGYGEKLLTMLPEDHPGQECAREICRAVREGERLSFELGSMAQSGTRETR